MLSMIGAFMSGFALGGLTVFTVWYRCEKRSRDELFRKHGL